MALRNAKFIARIALAWFALFLALAAASPLIEPPITQLICSVDGITKVAPTNDVADLTQHAHHLKCPLCTGVGAPPAFVLVFLDGVKASTALPQSIETDRAASKTGAALPPRGPPSLV